MPSALKFQVSGGSPVLIRNRDEGNTEVRERGQELGYTDGSQVFAYDLALNRVVYDFQISHLTEVDRDRLQSFFDSSAQGVFNAFTVTVPRLEIQAQGTAAPLSISGARFLSPRLQWAETDEGYWAVTFAIFTQQEGPTGPPTS